MWASFAPEYTVKAIGTIKEAMQASAKWPLRRRLLRLRRRIRREFGMLRFRLRFFRQYCLAMLHKRRMRTLEKITRQIFADAESCDVKVIIHRSLGFHIEEQERYHLGAPVMVTVWKETTNIAPTTPKEIPVIGMCLELRFNSILIYRLQGARVIAGTPSIPTLPKLEPPWGHLFARVCQEFARCEGFAKVFVPRAHTLLAFEKPVIRTQRRKPGSEAFKTRAVLVEEARKRLRRTYDDSARELGFIPGPKYSVWKNPDYVPWWKNIWKRRGIVETHNSTISRSPTPTDA